MACQQTLRAGFLLRNVGFSKFVIRASSLSSLFVSRVSPVCRMPSNSLSASTASTASFHTCSRMHNKHIIQIQDEEDFKTRVLANSKPVLVDFFANWCGPCKLLIPRLEALSAVVDGKAILAKIDIDEMPDIAGEYGVEAVPTVLAMKNGKIIDKFVGMKDDAELKSFVDKLTG